MSNPDFDPITIEDDPPAPPSDVGRLPVIIVGWWARLGTGSNVPKKYRGRDVAITLAPSERREADEFSPTPYAYQDEDTVFEVQVRDDNARLSLKRASFDHVGPFQLVGVPPS